MATDTTMLNEKGEAASPAILNRKVLLGKNLTCTACVSLFGVEFLQFISEKGTTNESFANYFDALVDKMK